MHRDAQITFRDRPVSVEEAEGAPRNKELSMGTKAIPLRENENDLFDLDLEIGVEQSVAGPAVTSISVCTPGCTSEGGGSGCSYCC